jgi:hypothetical protein
MLIEIAQRNVNSGFTIAKNLAAAKTLPEVVEVQAAYWAQLARHVHGPSRRSACAVDQSDCRYG